MELLPIFPLDLVHFPGVPLPLHIFEPRYKEMVTECIRDKQAFGMVRANKDGVAEVGCTTVVTQLLKTYEDGRMEILTIGQRRFEILEVNEERAFLRAQILWIDDEDAGAAPEPLRKSALELHRQFLEITGITFSVAQTSPQLSFQLATALPVDLNFKQTLLEMRSERQRIDTLLDYYAQIIPALREMKEHKRKAGGNGHLH